MADESVIELMKDYIQALQILNFDVRFVVLFGSFASGKTHKWSDIDVLVVSPELDGKRDIDKIVLLWAAAHGVDPRIEPIPCGEKQWTEDDSSAIIEIARRHGIVVAPREKDQVRG